MIGYSFGQGTAEQRHEDGRAISCGLEIRRIPSTRVLFTLTCVLSARH